MSLFAVKKDEIYDLATSLKESISKNNVSAINERIRSFLNYLKKSVGSGKSATTQSFGKSTTKDTEQEKTKLRESCLILITPYLMPEHDPVSLAKNVPKYLSTLPRMQCAQVIQGILERMRHIYSVEIVSRSYDTTIEWAKKENLQFLVTKLKQEKIDSVLLFGSGFFFDGYYDEFSELQTEFKETFSNENIDSEDEDDTFKDPKHLFGTDTINENVIGNLENLTQSAERAILKSSRENSFESCDNSGKIGSCKLASTLSSARLGAIGMIGSPNASVLLNIIPEINDLVSELKEKEATIQLVRAQCALAEAYLRTGNHKKARGLILAARGANLKLTIASQAKLDVISGAVALACGEYSGAYTYFQEAVNVGYPVCSELAISKLLMATLGKSADSLAILAGREDDLKQQASLGGDEEDFEDDSQMNNRMKRLLEMKMAEAQSKTTVVISEDKSLEIVKASKMIDEVYTNATTEDFFQRAVKLVVMERGCLPRYTCKPDEEIDINKIISRSTDIVLEGLKKGGINSSKNLAMYIGEKVMDKECIDSLDGDYINVIAADYTILEQVRTLAVAYRNRASNNANVSAFLKIFSTTTNNITTMDFVPVHIKMSIEKLTQTETNAFMKSILKPYKRIELDKLAQMTGMEKYLVITKLSNMILDGELNAEIDDTTSCLILNGSNNNTTAKFLPETVETLKAMNALTDAITLKAEL